MNRREFAHLISGTIVILLCFFTFWGLSGTIHAKTLLRRWALIDLYADHGHHGGDYINYLPIVTQ